MKTSVLRQTPRTDDDNYCFTVPALLLAATLATGGLTLMLGTISAEPTPAAAVPAANTPASEGAAPTFVGASVGTPLNPGVSMRRFLAAAALVALLSFAAAAQGPFTADQARAYAAAQVEYEVGNYAAAYTAFAALADGGHIESARVAMQMHRYGPGLYRMRFAAGPKQIGRWTALLSCRHQAPSGAGACLMSAGTGSAARR